MQHFEIRGDLLIELRRHVSVYTRAIRQADYMYLWLLIPPACWIERTHSFNSIKKLTVFQNATFIWRQYSYNSWKIQNHFVNFIEDQKKQFSLERVLYRFSVFVLIYCWKMLKILNTRWCSKSNQTRQMRWRRQTHQTRQKCQMLANVKTAFTSKQWFEEILQ